VWELPPLAATVTEYRLHTLICPQCGTATAAQLPPGVPTGAYGPRVAAAAATLTGQYHLSKRAAAALLETLCGLPISPAGISALEAIMSAALAAPVAEAREAVRAAERAWVDETGWAQQRDLDPTDPAPSGKLARAWLWVVVTAAATLFCIRRGRSAKVARELLGDPPRGIVHSDRHSAYHWLETTRRQLCWAHLQRDFQRLVERGGVAARVGEALRCETRRLFDLWHRIRDGTLARAEFIRQMASVQATLRTLLQQGATTADARTATFCRILQRLDPALWSFVTNEGVEPTNNRAERAIRPAVLWRKMSFGTQTSAGSRFVERVMTAAATCRQQQKNLLDYLTAVAEAAYHRQPSPSLLQPITAIL
jgi:transposase